MGVVGSLLSPPPSSTLIDTNDVKEELNIAVEESILSMDIKEEVNIPVEESIPSINIKEEVIIPVKESIPTLDIEEEMNIQSEQSMPLNDECRYNIITPESDSNTNLSSNSNIMDGDESTGHDSSRTELPVTLAYGPIKVKVRRTAVPTLATGRRSKFAELEGEEAARREVRRHRNREAAKKIKEKRISIEMKLEKEVSELESKERDLLSQIKNLETYKQYLEKQSEQTISINEKFIQPSSSTLLQIERNRRRAHQTKFVHRDQIQTKREPRSPSPQWQLDFSI